MVRHFSGNVHKFQFAKQVFVVFGFTVGIAGCRQGLHCARGRARGSSWCGQVEDRNAGGQNVGFDRNAVFLPWEKMGDF